MKDYYEELWAALPEKLEPPDWKLRWGFLRGAVAPGDRVLDLGAGAGDFAGALAREGVEVIGVEVAEGALGRARSRHPGLEFRLAPLDGPLPLEDGSFDVVWASEVIEHVADTARWLAEVRRVLAPGGSVLLTTPSHGRLRVALGGVEHFSEPLGDHLHLYTKRSLAVVLEELGFGQVRVRAVGGPLLLKRILLARAVRPPPFGGFR
jgi:ubiquinone/menaquinone biosynthesis C-methylase UbiE